MPIELRSPLVGRQYRLRMPTTSVKCQKQLKRSKNGNSMFARLPPEIRCLIWEFLLVHQPGWIEPVHITSDSLPERFSLARNSSKATCLTRVMSTCRLFWHDQEAHNIFYKFNEFVFEDTKACLTYIAAIMPAKRKAIRHIRIRGDSENPWVIEHFGNSDLVAVASMCLALRILRLGTFCQGNVSLVEDADCAAAVLKPVVALLPLLAEVGLRSQHRSFGNVQCRMTNKETTFSKRYLANFRYFSIQDDKTRWKEGTMNALQSGFEQFRSASTRRSKGISSSKLDKILQKTPLKVYGENRGKIHYFPWVSDGTRSHMRDNPGVSRNTILAFGQQNHPNPPINIRLMSKRRKTIQVQRKKDSRWLTWSKVFWNPRWNDLHSQNVMKHILLLLEKQDYIKRPPGFVPPRMLIENVRRLEWKDKEVERHVINQLRRLGAKEDQCRKARRRNQSK